MRPSYIHIPVPVNLTAVLQQDRVLDSSLGISKISGEAIFVRMSQYESG